MDFFVERERRRPRAFWRLVIQFSVSTLLSLLAISLLQIPLLAAGGSSYPSETSTLYVVASIGTLVATLTSLVLAARFWDRRRFSDYGFGLDGGWFSDLLLGMLLGALLMSGVFFVQLALGWVSVSGTFSSGSPGTPFWTSILPPAVTFLCVGIYEEAASRGYQLRNIAEGLNYPALGARGAVIVAWILSSAVFGLLHLGNPNATLISTVNISCAGILLGAGYVLTGKLAIPIGLHITWNFFQGSVFGFPVSGLTNLGGSFVTIEQSGPELLTGGEFGPEAGLIGLLAILFGGAAIWLFIGFRDGWHGIEKSIADSPETGNITPDI